MNLLPTYLLALIFAINGPVTELDNSTEEVSKVECTSYSIEYHIESMETIFNAECKFNEIPLYGKVKFVESFGDIKIQFVESFPDIKVKFVSSFPNECGKWQVVESFPDFTVQIVESFPDLKVKSVNSFPGIN